MISRTPLDIFRLRYNIPDSTENLEEYLGSNWKTVLNFWEYCCTLTETQWKGILDEYANARKDILFRGAADREVYRLFASYDTIDPYKLFFIPGEAIFGDSPWSYAIIIIGHATLELIDMSENKPLIFVPFFDKP